MGLFDGKSDYDHGKEDSASKDKESLTTVLDDLATDLNPFSPPGYSKGYDDGIEERE